MKKSIILSLITLGVVAIVGCTNLSNETLETTGSDSVSIDSIFGELEKELGEDIATIIDTIERDSLNQ